MKVLVTGVAGQLGHDVMNELAKRGHEGVGSDLAAEYSGIADGSAVTKMPYVSMDITDAAAVEMVLQEVKPDAVVHCAAWTAVDLAEDDDKVDKVRSINAGGTKNIAEVCKKLDCKMVYLSTDYVFDGQGTKPWDPDCKTYQPLNVYGQTKLEGELAVSETLDKYFIVRIAWVFGINGKNFIKTMLNVGKTHDTVRVVNDQIGAPTPAHWIAEYTVAMLERMVERADGVPFVLEELIRSMEAFESLRGFLEHVSLVMDAEQNENLDAVSIMTLHSAKGLEFETVFLPGWEEGLFPHQRALDEGGRSGLEEERRLAYVGITRAKRRCHIWFVSNRRIHGLWQSTMPSRFLDELPAAHVEVAEAETSYGGYGRNPYGQSRFDKQEPFQNSYSTPGWKRAQANKTDATRDNWGTRSGHAVERIGYGESGPRAKTIEGELVAKSTTSEPSRFSVGDRVFHLKFGNGNIASIEGNKLTIDFDRAGQKRVLDGFVEKAG